MTRPPAPVLPAPRHRRAPTTNGAPTGPSAPRAPRQDAELPGRDAELPRRESELPRPRPALEPAARHLRRGWLVRRAVWALFALVLAAGIMLLFVFPGRTLLAQNRSLTQEQHRLQVLNQENAQLAQRAKQLQNSAEIEQLARADYGLVLPGEQSYAVLPAPSPTTTTTAPPAP